MSDATRPPSIAEIAALTARLRALTKAGADVDPDERARFLADKDALLDRIAAHEPPAADVDDGDPWADYRTYTPAQAADELVARGVPPDAAPAMVDRHLDGLTRDRGQPPDRWEIDDDDVAAILHTPGGVHSASGDDEDTRRHQLATWHDEDANLNDDAEDRAPDDGITP
jgi:hypothetical protein